MKRPMWKGEQQNPLYEQALCLYDRQALADYLGVERSAMAAEISRLQKQGVIETKRNWFRLHQAGNMD